MLMADKDFCVHLAHLHNMFTLQVRLPVRIRIQLHNTNMTAQSDSACKQAKQSVS